MHRKQPSKEELKEEMQSVKRLDDKYPNMKLNSELIRRYHTVLPGLYFYRFRFRV